MVKVRIPAPLRPKAGNQPEVIVPAKTLQEAVHAVVAKHPDLKAHLLADDGSFHRFVNYFVNGKDARTLQGAETRVTEADTILVLPAVAGGQDGGFGGLSVEAPRQVGWEGVRGRHGLPRSAARDAAGGATAS